MLPLGADETLENPDKLRGVSPFLDFDVDADADAGVESTGIFAPTIFPIESLESVEGADDKSEKTGGVSGKPVLSLVSSRSNGDGGDIDENFFDSSLGDKDNLLILFFGNSDMLCYVILIIWDTNINTNTKGYYIITTNILII